MKDVFLSKSTHKYGFIAAIIVVVLFSGIAAIHAQQQEIESTKYEILDNGVDSGGGVNESSGGYGLVTSLGNPTADARLTSSSYALGSGFPSGIQANVPIVRCFETNTTASSPTSCTHLPNSDGAQGECGEPGCYDRAKIEIDTQSNPHDTLYLVSIYDDTNSIQYYLQSDNSIGATATYLDICAIQGRHDDTNNPDCNTSGDTDWDADLQSMNIYGLLPDTQYTVKVRALSGDFTETQYSQTVTATTELPTLSLDIDIADDSGSSTETSSPYNIDLGTLFLDTVTTATHLIWLDLGTNLQSGLDTYVADDNNGLDSGSDTIPSSSEDLDTDTDGGYGLKFNSCTYPQTSLGPVAAAGTYDTSGANEVGGLSTTNALIFSTDTSGSTDGPVSDGRCSTYVKAVAHIEHEAGAYSDTIRYYLLAGI